MPLWGAWDDAGGKGMRVGLEITITAGNDGPIVHGTTQAKVTVEYWTENRTARYSNDTQTMNLGGAIGGSITYNNNQTAGTQTRRDVKVYFYDYGPNDYGGSPLTKTFAGTVTGADNGVKPTQSLTVPIPGRPIDNPAATTGCAVSRISDAASTISWTNHSTSGEPYGTITVARQYFGYGGFAAKDWEAVASLGGGSQTFTDTGVLQNRKYQYYTQVSNSAGNSGFDISNVIYTSPYTPISCVRTPSGADQVITWTNRVNYAEHGTEVWRAANGSYSLVAYLGSGVQTYTDYAPANTTRWKYMVRTYSTSGLYTDFSNETSETDLVVPPPVDPGPSYSAPNPPTGLAPDGNTVQDGATAITLSWGYNSTDGTPQTRFQLRHRQVGAGTWTTVDQGVGTASYVLPANSYSSSMNVEWQVSTWGYLSTAQSGWSAVATWKTKDPVPKKYPLYLDVDTGRIEASSTGALPGGGGGGGTTATGIASVRIAGGSLSNITLSGLQTIDGVTMVAGDRVLVRAQTTATQNGIYVAASGAWTRSSDYPVPGFWPLGSTVYCEEGNANKKKTFWETEPNPAANGPQWDPVVVIDLGGSFFYPTPIGSGHLFYDQNNHVIAVWDGTAWAHAGQPFICTSTTRPGSPSDGAIIYETDTTRLMIYQGGAWRSGSGATPAFTFVQGVAAATWVIDHPLTFRPNVSVVDSTGRQVEGDVVYTDADTVTIDFTSAFAGTAYLS